MIHSTCEKNLQSHTFLAGIWAKAEVEGLADENKDLGFLSNSN